MWGKMGEKVFNLLMLSSFLQFLVVGAVTYEEDTTITLDQADALEEFRNLVRSKLPHKYMEESIFLVNWLKDQNFDVGKAEQMLLKHIAWRAENKMDEIDDEEWEDFKAEFPWNLDGVDKEGRPLVQFVLKKWGNVTKLVQKGRADLLARWEIKYIEDATKLVRKSHDQGIKVTRFSVLLDGDGFTPLDFGCPACVKIYIKVLQALDQQFPGSFEKFVVVNASQPYREIINHVLLALSNNFRRGMKVYGMDRKTWRKFLSSMVDDDQLLPEFGGTMREESCGILNFLRNGPK